MPIWQKPEEKQENFYICREKEKGMLFLFGVCHLSEQKCINAKIGMGAGLEIDKETDEGDLCSKVHISVCHF